MTQSDDFINGLTDEDLDHLLAEADQMLNRTIKEKSEDDYTFEVLFNDAIKYKHYSASNSLAVFIIFEEEFNDLYRYYQYTRRYVNAYEKKQMEYAESIDDPVITDFEMPYGELIRINQQSVLLMTYACFESFLRNFIDYLDDSAGVLKAPYGDMTTLEYIQYLKNKGILVPESLYNDFDEVRLVRNFYAHSLTRPQSSLIKKLQKRDPYRILNGTKAIGLNNRYMEFVFNTFGKMVAAIEKAFKKYHTGD